MRGRACFLGCARSPGVFCWREASLDDLVCDAVLVEMCRHACCLLSFRCDLSTPVLSGAAGWHHSVCIHLTWSYYCLINEVGFF